MKEGEACSDDEIFLALVIMSHTSGVSADNGEALGLWIRAFAELKDEGGAHLTASTIYRSWEPPLVYNKGKGRIHPLLAQGRGYLEAFDTPSLRAVTVVMIQQQRCILTSSNLKWLLRRMLAAPSSQHPTQLKFNGDFNIDGVVTSKSLPRVKLLLPHVVLQVLRQPRLPQLCAELFDMAQEALLALAGPEAPFCTPASPTKTMVKASSASLMAKVSSLEEELENQAAVHAAALHAVKEKAKAELALLLKDIAKFKKAESKHKAKKEKASANKANLRVMRAAAAQKTGKEVGERLAASALAKKQKVVDEKSETVTELRVVLRDLKADIRERDNSMEEAREAIVDLEEGAASLQRMLEHMDETVGKVKVFELEDNKRCPGWLRLCVYELVTLGVPVSGHRGQDEARGEEGQRLRLGAAQVLPGVRPHAVQDHAHGHPTGGAPGAPAQAPRAQRRGGRRRARPQGPPEQGHPSPRRADAPGLAGG